MYSREDEILLTKHLLIALGIDIGENHTLVEQYTGTQLNFENKVIKAINDPNDMLYISESDISLEPANPRCTKLMERLFGRFIDIEVEDECIPDMLTYYFDIDEEKEKFRMTIKFNNGTKWIGNWYYNKVLSYVEAILAIDGTFSGSDLTIFDIPKKEREGE